MTVLSMRPGRFELVRGPVAVGAAGVAAAALLRARDPHESGSYGYCPILLITGRPCPGCGGLRSVSDLTRGDLVGAISSNVLAVVLVGVLTVAWVGWVLRRWRGRGGGMFAVNERRGYAVLALAIVFGVLRNTPAGSWLAP